MNDHIAEASKKVGRPQIREVCLRNGARIEPDRDDLPDWVYESAFELLELAAPAAEGEPVGHDWDDQDKCRRCGDRDWYASATCTPKQQPASDVAGLVEALSGLLRSVCIQWREDVAGRVKGTWSVDAEKAAEAALAAHRKQGGGV